MDRYRVSEVLRTLSSQWNMEKELSANKRSSGHQIWSLISDSLIEAGISGDRADCRGHRYRTVQYQHEFKDAYTNATKPESSTGSRPKLATAQATSSTSNSNPSAMSQLRLDIDRTRYTATRRQFTCRERHAQME